MSLWLRVAEFAMFPLLDNPKALAAIRATYCAQLDVAAEYGLFFLLTGLDYRASADWGASWVIRRNP